MTATVITDQLLDTWAEQLRKIAEEESSTRDINRWIKKLNKVLGNAPDSAINILLENYDQQTQMHPAPCSAGRDLNRVAACPFINGGELMMQQLLAASAISYQRENSFNDALRFYIGYMVEFYGVERNTYENSELVQLTDQLIKKTNRHANARTQVRAALKM